MKPPPTLPSVSPARAERIAAACAALVDLLAGKPALQPVTVLAGARETASSELSTYHKEIETCNAIMMNS